MKNILLTIGIAILFASCQKETDNIIEKYVAPIDQITGGYTGSTSLLIDSAGIKINRKGLIDISIEKRDTISIYIEESSTLGKFRYICNKIEMKGDTISFKIVLQVINIKSENSIFTEFVNLGPASSNSNFGYYISKDKKLFIKKDGSYVKNSIWKNFVSADSTIKI